MDDEDVAAKIAALADTIIKDVQFEAIADKLIAQNLLTADDFNYIIAIPQNSERVSFYLKGVLPSKQNGGATFLNVLRQANYGWIADKIMPLSPKNVALRGKEKSRLSAPTEPKLKRQKISDVDVVDATAIQSDTLGVDEDVCGSQTFSVKENRISDNNNTTSPSKEKENIKLSKEVISMVSNDRFLLSRWRSFCHTLDLDCEIPTIHRYLCMDPEDAKIPVIHLLKAWQQQNPKDAHLGNLIKYLRDNKANELADNLEDTFMISPAANA